MYLQMYREKTLIKKGGGNFDQSGRGDLQLHKGAQKANLTTQKGQIMSLIWGPHGSPREEAGAKKTHMGYTVFSNNGIFFFYY